MIAVRMAVVIVIAVISWADCSPERRELQKAITAERRALLLDFDR